MQSFPSIPFCQCMQEVHERREVTSKVPCACSAFRMTGPACCYVGRTPAILCHSGVRSVCICVGSTKRKKQESAMLLASSSLAITGNKAWQTRMNKGGFGGRSLPLTCPSTSSPVVFLGAVKQNVLEPVGSLPADKTLLGFLPGHSRDTEVRLKRGIFWTCG